MSKPAPCLRAWGGLLAIATGAFVVAGPAYGRVPPSRPRGCLVQDRPAGPGRPSSDTPTGNVPRDMNGPLVTATLRCDSGGGQSAAGREGRSHNGNGAVTGPRQDVLAVLVVLAGTVLV